MSHFYRNGVHRLFSMTVTVGTDISLTPNNAGISNTAFRQNFLSRVGDVIVPNMHHLSTLVQKTSIVYGDQHYSSRVDGIFFQR